MVKSKIDTLFFDAAGTLIRLTEPVGKSYAKIARRHGLAMHPDTATTAFLDVWRSKPHREAGNAPRPYDDQGWWREVAFDVVERACPERPGFDAEAWFKELYEYFAQPGVWAAFPEVESMLERLRPHYRMAVVSNFDRRLHRVLKNLGLADYFETLIVSSEIGAEKPHPRIFHAAMEKLAVTPDRVLHVGDDAVRDAEGAGKVGMRTFLVNRPEITLRDLPRALSSMP